MNKQDFFDREIFLDILEKRIKDLKEGYRQNIAIIGEESIGKTSVVLHFLNRFSDPSILPLYLEVKPEYSQEQFIHKFIGVILYNFLENSNIPRNEDLDFLISKAGKFIPKTVEAIKAILISLKTKAKQQNLFIQILSLCDILTSETGKHCVIIFDEFHHLGSLEIKQLYKQFSKMLMIQKNVLYIILSSAKFKAKKILSSHLSLLFGNFQIIEMQPFDLKTTEDFLQTRLAHLRMEKRFLNFLIHFTGGLPLYLEIIANTLLNISGSITVDKLTHLLQDLLFVESGILNQRFSLYLKRLENNLKLTQDYQTLLHLIADGGNKLEDISASLHKPKSQIQSRLNILLEYDVITKYGDFYVITDRIFNFWLKFVYREKLYSLNFNLEEQKKNFRLKVEEKINQFELANQKTILERTMELLRLFENEAIEIRTKRIRLTHFKEIKSLSFHGKRLDKGILGRSKDSLWIMAIKPDELTEEDIVEFSNECQRLRYAKPQRKVIITYDNIEHNVRLKAMEEKVLTWDLNDLNQILDIYNKPGVIP